MNHLLATGVPIEAPEDKKERVDWCQGNIERYNEGNFLLPG